MKEWNEGTKNLFETCERTMNGLKNKERDVRESAFHMMETISEYGGGERAQFAIEEYKKKVDRYNEAFEKASNFYDSLKDKLYPYFKAPKKIDLFKIFFPEAGKYM